MHSLNKSIRDAARIADIPLWRVAAELGISEPTLTRWLRFPLLTEKEMRIMKAIEKLAKEAE